MDRTSLRMREKTEIRKSKSEDQFSFPWASTFDATLHLKGLTLPEQGRSGVWNIEFKLCSSLEGKRWCLLNLYTYLCVFNCRYPTGPVVQPWSSLRASLKHCTLNRDLNARSEVLAPCRCVVDIVTSTWIHVSTDAGAPTYMYEFEYRPSFVSAMRPKAVIGDHGDEIFSVFGSPFLKGNVSLLPDAWALGGLNRSLGWMTSCKFFLFSPVSFPAIL